MRIITTNRIALTTYILCYITINVENKRQLEKEQYEKKMLASSICTLKSFKKNVPSTVLLKVRKTDQVHSHT